MRTELDALAAVLSRSFRHLDSTALPALLFCHLLCNRLANQCDSQIIQQHSGRADAEGLGTSDLINERTHFHFNFIN